MLLSGIECSRAEQNDLTRQDLMTTTRVRAECAAAALVAVALLGLAIPSGVAQVPLPALIPGLRSAPVAGGAAARLSRQQSGGVWRPDRDNPAGECQPPHLSPQPRRPRRSRCRGGGNAPGRGSAGRPGCGRRSPDPGRGQAAHPGQQQGAAHGPPTRPGEGARHARLAIVLPAATVRELRLRSPRFFLGSVLTPGSRLSRGAFTGVPVDVAFLNQDQRYGALTLTQPITALFKVRQGVRIAKADERIAAIQVDKARRELQKGVEDLYFGLLAARRIQAGAVVVTGAVEMAAASPTAQVRLAALQARQGLQAASKEVAGLTEQLNSLLGLPLCTELELAEPAPVVAPVACADEAIGLALTASPDIQEARATIEKASAGVRVAKLAFMPELNLLGFSVAQDGVPSIQHGFSGVALVGSVPLFDGGAAARRCASARPFRPWPARSSAIQRTRFAWRPRRPTASL